MHRGNQCYAKHFAASWLSSILLRSAMHYQMDQRVCVRQIAHVTAARLYEGDSMVTVFVF